MTTASRILECTELEYILLGDLRDLLDEPETPETVRWLEAVLDALLDTIPEEFALKSGDGYLNEVLEDYPNWHSSVEKLENEYYALFRRLRQLREKIRNEEDYSSIADEVARELRQWMHAFRAHHQAEQRLVSLAANLEVGVGD
jgi:hypothetical protein